MTSALAPVYASASFGARGPHGAASPDAEPSGGALACEERARGAELRRRLAGLPACLALCGALAAPALAAPDVKPVRVVVAVLPFEVHSEKPLDYLEASLADLLATRLEASGQVDVVEAVTVRETLIAWPGEKTEDALRRLARELRADWVVVGSLTELAGHYSLDVRVTPAESPVATRTWCSPREGDDELLDRVNELASQILGIVGGASMAPRVARVEVVGAPDEAALRAGCARRPPSPTTARARARTWWRSRRCPGSRARASTPSTPRKAWW